MSSVPLGVLAMMYEAVLDDPSAPRPTIAQMRRMVKMLIDRALVLGPVDRFGRPVR